VLLASGAGLKTGERVSLPTAVADALLDQGVVGLCDPVTEQVEEAPKHRMVTKRKRTKRP